jgi:hypothetical protein
MVSAGGGEVRTLMATTGLSQISVRSSRRDGATSARVSPLAHSNSQSYALPGRRSDPTRSRSLLKPAKPNGLHYRATGPDAQVTLAWSGV